MSSLLLMTMMMINAQVVTDTSKIKDSIQVQCQEVMVEQMNINQELKNQLEELKKKLNDKKDKKEDK